MKTALRSQIKTAFSMAGAAPWPPACCGFLGPAGTKKRPDRDRMAVANPNRFFDGWSGLAASAWMWVPHCRRPIVDGAACSTRSCRTCCLAWLFRSCVCCCRAVARDSALLYKVGGGRDVCIIFLGLRVNLGASCCCAPFDFPPLESKRARCVNLRLWKPYCECHPKILQRYPR